MSDKIKVALRVRPFNRRGNYYYLLLLTKKGPWKCNSQILMTLLFSELELDTENVIEMTDKQTILKYPTSSDKIER